MKTRIKPFTALPKCGGIFKTLLNTISHNGWVFVSCFALHNAQFKGQMLVAKIAQIPCYKQCGVYRQMFIRRTTVV